MWPAVEDCRPFRAVNVGREIFVASRNRSAIDEQLRTILERIFNRIAIEVLVDRVATIVSTADGLCHDRPSSFRPTSFVDVVNQKVADRTTAGPQEAVEVPDLMLQLTHSFSAGPTAAEPVGPAIR